MAMPSREKQAGLPDPLKVRNEREREAGKLRGSAKRNPERH